MGRSEVRSRSRVAGRLTAAIAIGALALTGAFVTVLAGPASAGAAPPTNPVVQVSPDVALTDGEVVQVSAQGFTPGHLQTILQCSTAGKCVVGSQVTADGSGAFGPSPFVVHQTFIAMDSTPVDCTLIGCFIAVSESQTVSGIANISFGAAPGNRTLLASPNSSLTEGQSVQLTGQGFTGFTTVNLLQCSSDGHCTAPTQLLSSATGTFGPTPFTVHETFTATDSTLVNCAIATFNCSIIAAENANAFAGASITFANARSVTITPVVGLNDLMSVSVKGQNYTPNATVTLIQCGPNNVCDNAHLQQVQANGSGAFGPTDFTVYQSFSSVDCTEVRCSVYAAESQTALAGHLISFGPSSFTVSQSTGLDDGDTVQISATNLIKNVTYYFAECGSAALGPSGCDTSFVVTVASDASGDIPATPFVVKRVLDTPSGPIDCGAGTCRIVGSSDGTTGDVEQALGFTPPAFVIGHAVPPSPDGSVIVAACRAPGAVAFGCSSLQFTTVAFDSFYRLPLPPGTWNVQAFRFSGPVGPDTLADQTPPVTVSLVAGQTVTCEFAFGGALPDCDVDGDGVVDAIDSGVGAFTDAIDDPPDQPDTIGSIVALDAELSILIVDEPDPAGVRVTVVGEGTGEAVLEVCGGTELHLAAGSEVVLTCGSVKIQVVTGLAELVLSDDTTVSVPEGVTVTLEENTDGTFEITQVSGGTVTLTIDGTSVEVDEPTTVIATWDFLGFTRPVDNPDVLNVVKAGQAVPLKWRLLDESGAPVTTLTNATISVEQFDCDLGTKTDVLEAVAAGSSELQNLGEGYYQMNWKTPKGYAGSCKTMKLDLGEGGVTRDALMEFK